MKNAFDRHLFWRANENECSALLKGCPTKSLIRGSCFHALIIWAALSVPVITSGQVAITGSDMFNQPGLYYRAHVNHFEPMDISGGTAYVVPSNLIGSAGANRFWDFSSGPKDKVLRFDYMAPTGQVEAVNFPTAKVVERKTDESDGSHEWLFFEQVPGLGRKVYGFYAQNPLFTPSNVFVPPIVDFPDRITFGQEWTTSTSYEGTLNVNTPPDPGDDEDEEVFALSSVSNFRQRITLTSKFKVDAHGTIVLPDELGNFGQGLRINEEVTVDVAIDFGEGQFDHVETDFVRNYYWVMPGYGIVAQLNSTQSASPVPENFTRATAFLRLFETNKKPVTSGGCTDPLPVTDLRIRISNGVILLTWSKVECATQYRVEYTSTPFVSSSWKALGEPTPNALWQGENFESGTARYYRVVSLK